MDLILGDPVLNARDHIALSDTCLLLRHGYHDEIWEVRPSPLRAPSESRSRSRPLPQTFCHGGSTPSKNHFTYANLEDPLSEKESQRITTFAAGPAEPKQRIWSVALASTRPVGVDYGQTCYKERHKKCKCAFFVFGGDGGRRKEGRDAGSADCERPTLNSVGLKVQGKYHSQCISDVNALETT